MHEWINLNDSLTKLLLETVELIEKAVAEMMSLLAKHIKH